MKLESGLKHQENAVNSIISVLKDVEIYKPNSLNANPKIDLNSSTLWYNIKKVQEINNINLEYRKNDIITNSYLNLDIKMETGTGKTFTQIKTIFELYRKYGFTKFVIIVPTKPIKAGTKGFIESIDTKKFFRDEYDNVEIELSTIEPLKKRKGREYFPGVVRQFVSASNDNTKKIQVMLINSQLITNGKMLTKEYDTSILEDYTIPKEAIKITLPVVIIDEPHKFDKNNVTYKKIESIFSPQLIIRFGATFPFKDSKNKERDYQHLLYNLTSVQAFKENLVKGVISECVPTHSKYDVKVKIVNINNKEKCNIQKIDDRGIKTYELYKNDSLSIVHKDFEGIVILEIRKNSILLSNGVEFFTNQELVPASYSMSYQDMMIETALERHFEIEEENYNKGIKSLALFFIDDVSSYRKLNDKPAYILESFENILKDKLREKINILKECEYKEYLKQSLESISKCHAGYFSIDNSDTSDETLEQVDEILNNKEKLLKIKDSNNNFNLRRFIFSKWTLKEGWDNPNIFTIAKLRSSGSENSKLQEVGRGLRLPVNNNLNRINNEQFFLNYIVSFSEKNFINDLRNEINIESNSKNKISLEEIKEYCVNKEIEYTPFYINLLSSGAIDPDGNIINGDKLYEQCPELNDRVSKNKIFERKDKDEKNINIRKNKYNEISKLWELLNRKYIINYESFDDGEIEKALLNILNSDIDSVEQIITDRNQINLDELEAKIEQLAGISLNTNRTLKYNSFLKRINEITNIPIVNIHNALVKYNEVKKINATFFNNTVLTRFCNEINNWKAEELFKRFTYKNTDLPIHPTALTNLDGTIKDTIVIGNVGNSKSLGTPQEKYLYDTIAFDSEIERKNILEEINEVIVFGKIPKNSIKIPVADGGTYSPDFMYLIDKKDGNKELNLVIESKNVTSERDLRSVENYKIECAKKLFQQLEKSGISIKFRKQLSNDKIGSVIKNLIK